MSPRHSSANNRIFDEIESKRQHMIAEAAYYLSERRGFQGDADTQFEDWLLAEREIDKLLKEEIG